MSSGSIPRAASSWRTTEWWYLSFLLLLVFQPTFDPGAGAREWIVTGAVVLVFVVFYARVHTHAGALRHWSPQIAAVLGLLVFPFNGGASVLLVYAAAFAGAYRSRRVALRWFAGLSALTLALGLMTPIGMPAALLFFAVPAVFVWVVGLSVLDEARRDRETEQLRIDNARIERLATAAERERIAADLHDLLGQSLTEAIVRAQLVRRLVGTDPGRAAEEAAEIEQTSRRALDEVRATVHGWREVVLDDELETARRALAAAGVALTVCRDPGFDPPPMIESALALALREAVTNVIRHADASRCHVALRREGTHDLLEVADDGPHAADGEGGGLRGMRERIVALGGSVDRTTSAGTALTVRVPAGLAE